MRILGLLLVVVLTGCATGGRDRQEPDAGPAESVSVIRVVDGDSLEMASGQEPLEVRLAGVNAPEEGECHHLDATERLKTLVDRGGLTMTRMGRDRYGRVLATIRAAGADVALEMVRGGHGLAVAGEADEEALLDAEQAAFEEGLGMWSVDCGIGPVPSLRFDPPASVTDRPGRDEERTPDELVVLVSEEEAPVDLSGWQLRDGSSRHRLRFDRGPVLSPGDSLAISSADPRWSPGAEPVWSNQGDIALLVDPSGRIVARWRYRGS